MSQIEDMNTRSMNIILHAGDARVDYTEALDKAEKGDFEGVDALTEKANQEIIEAHRIQTRMIQDAIEEDDPDMTVLFIHAQDTLMTIKTEFAMTKRMIDLYKKLSSKE